MYVVWVLSQQYTVCVGGGDGVCVCGEGGRCVCVWGGETGRHGGGTGEARGRDGGGEAETDKVYYLLSRNGRRSMSSSNLASLNSRSISSENNTQRTNSTKLGNY